MFGKPADKRLAVLSAVENCIEETVEHGTKRIQPISRATIWIISWVRTADPHRIQLKQMLTRMLSQRQQAAST